LVVLRLPLLPPPMVAEAIRETVVGQIQADHPLQEEGHVNYR
jgi:hypothetical protein